jgi:homoserine dehydrogenase
MKIALLGYGNVGKAFARLLQSKRSIYPFPVVGIHTAHHGSAFNSKGLGLAPAFGEGAATVAEFLERAQPSVVIEITTLNPESGEPAISHIRAAFSRKAHVITANKGPIAHAYAELRDEAQRAGVEFRFESTVMDGTPVFNQFRNDLPAMRVLGFTGVLNSTSKVVVAAMARGLSMKDGVKEAQAMGVAEADASFDLDGWDSAAKAAALANVLMDARVKPQDVERAGLRSYSSERIVELAREGKTVLIVSRGQRAESGVRLEAKAEVIALTDLLASAQGTSNLLLFHTDLMGTLGTISINPGVEQTAYGLFSDLVDVAKSVR